MTILDLTIEDLARLDRWQFRSAWEALGEAVYLKARAASYQGQFGGSDFATSDEQPKPEVIEQEVERLSEPDVPPSVGAPSVGDAGVGVALEPAIPAAPAPAVMQAGPFGDCSVCRAGFDSNYSRAQHVRWNHGNKTPPPSFHRLEKSEEVAREPKQDIPRSSEAGDVCRWCSKQCGGVAGRKTHESYCEARPMAKRAEGEHIHHWKMEPPNRPVIPGRCDCGATREDPASPTPIVKTADRDPGTVGAYDRGPVPCDVCGTLVGRGAGMASHKRFSHKAEEVATG